MPQLIPFTEDEILEMQRMRWAGASLREIAAHFDTSAGTVFSYVRGVRPEPGGQVLEYVPIDYLQNWRAVLPEAGILLPRWFAKWMEARVRTAEEPHFDGSHSMDSEE